MKEFRVSMRIRNHRLVSAREAEGWSQSKAAEYIGVPAGTISALECMRQKAWCKDGDLSSPARRLANFYDLDPEWLFPPVADEVKHHVLETSVDGHELATARQLKSQVQAAVKGMVAERWDGVSRSRVLRLRFGLDDGIERNLETVGAELGVSRERVRQIEIVALRRLREKRRDLLELME